MGKLEKQLVKDRIEPRLDYWQLMKVVIHYDNLENAGRKFIRGRWIMQTKKGRPDLVVYIAYQGQCWIYFIEAKRPDGKGVWGKDQKLFAIKFNNLLNVVYEVVEDSRQIDRTIEKITKFQQNQIDSIT